MPRKKVEKKIKAQDTGGEIKEVPPEHEAPIVFEGAEVVSILAENENAYHCKMSNGTTTWIPKSVFKKEL